jgi:hypothetical protein
MSNFVQRLGSAVADARSIYTDLAQGNLPPPSPPGEQAAASGDEARQPGTNDWAGNRLSNPDANRGWGWTKQLERSAGNHLQALRQAEEEGNNRGPVTKRVSVIRTAEADRGGQVLRIKGQAALRGRYQ